MATWHSCAAETPHHAPPRPSIRRHQRAGLEKGTVPVFKPPIASALTLELAAWYVMSMLRILVCLVVVAVGCGGQPVASGAGGASGGAGSGGSASPEAFTEFQAVDDALIEFDCLPIQVPLDVRDCETRPFNEPSRTGLQAIGAMSVSLRVLTSGTTSSTKPVATAQAAASITPITTS